MTTFDPDQALVDALLFEAQAASNTPETNAERPLVVMNNRPLRVITANVVRVLDHANKGFSAYPPIKYISASSPSP